MANPDYTQITVQQVITAGNTEIASLQGQQQSLASQFASGAITEQQMQQQMQAIQSQIDFLNGAQQQLINFVNQAFATN